MLQVVKSDSATVVIPELEFEIPAQTQKGTITTLEGLLTDASANLAGAACAHANTAHSAATVHLACSATMHLAECMDCLPCRIT